MAARQAVPKRWACYTVRLRMIWLKLFIHWALSSGVRKYRYVDSRRSGITTDSLRTEDLNSTPRTDHTVSEYGRSFHVPTTHAPKMRWVAEDANPLGLESGSTFGPPALAACPVDWETCGWGACGWEACALMVHARLPQDAIVFLINFNLALEEEN